MFPGETVMSCKALGLSTKHNSEFQVMPCQGTGEYYIGTMYVDCGEPDCHDCDEYNYSGKERKQGKVLDYASRETEYFKTREEAETALEEYLKTGYLDKQRG